MTTITVSQYVDIEVDLDDISVDKLAKALVRKDNYMQALDKARGIAIDEGEEIDSFEHDNLRALVDAYRSGKPINAMLSDFAYNTYGLVC